MPDSATPRAGKTPPPPASAARIEAKTPELRVNGRAYYPSTDPEMPLLWYLRDVLRLTGTKFGCGIGVCGACTVLIDGKAARACQTPVRAALEHEVTTIEGLAPAGGLHALQRAWIEEDVAQCGYCQAGQIMAASALLASNPKPNDQQIDQAMVNACRCGTYVRIRQAIKTAAGVDTKDTREA